MSLKLGIIGYGGMAGWHHENCTKVSGVEVVAAYDIDPERVALAEYKGLTGYRTLNSFLADERVNTVLVATPNDFHCELVCAALNAGKHAISEKPVAMNVAELDQMIAAAKGNGRIFTVHQNRRWDKDFVTAKAVYDSGELGKVYAVQSRLHGMGGIMHGWRGEPQHGGGMIYDWGVHFLDQIYCLVGYDEITAVKCSVASVKNALVDDYFDMVIDTRSGLHIVVEIGTFVLHENPRWMIMGDQGTLRIDDFAANGKLIKVNTLTEDVPVIVMTSAGPTRTFAPRPKDVKLELDLPALDPQWTEFYANVRDAIDGKAQLIVQPWQVRKVLHLMECAFQSARTGKQVEVQP
ncbi:MAG: Gfo/Idh/MocA family oxidoreductase [Clostridiales bacterium]|nr:Gfo/Idh/MocA family oxidoreductase [Clostridiales bacterium]